LLQVDRQVPKFDYLVNQRFFCNITIGFRDQRQPFPVISVSMIQFQFTHDVFREANFWASLPLSAGWLLLIATLIFSQEC